MTLGILSHQEGVHGLKPVQTRCCLQNSLVHSQAECCIHSPHTGLPTSAMCSHSFNELRVTPPVDPLN